MASPLSSVQASLRALKECNAGLDVDLKHQIVTRSDRGENPSQVKLIAGGGAGHEPGHVGFVGRAFLTTAISGAIFTSPPVQAILQGILLTGPKETPILLIVKNYSGDRLNFALAEEMARNRFNYRNIRTILVADDVALQDVPEQVGNRGLAGVILLHKIAGAMAECGKSLGEIHEFGENSVNKKLRTIGFSFTVDGGGWLRNIEIGKGVHGEPGAFKLDDQKDFSEIVNWMVKRFKEIIPSGASVVVLLNNLGGAEHHFNVFCDAFIGQLKFLRVVKIIAGSFFTSLGHSGASVTLLEVASEHEEDVLMYLEYETDLFRAHFRKSVSESKFIEGILEIENKSSSPGGAKHPVDGERFKRILLNVCEAIVLNQGTLNEMDQEFGDGDTGDTVARGATAIKDDLINNDRHLNFDNPSEVFQAISYLLSCRMGGTSGALLGIFFESSADALRENGFKNPHWLQVGNRVVSEVGRSKRGHRTMLDVLLVVQEWLQSVGEVNSSSLAELKGRVKETIEATKQMIPGSGRAVYNRSNAQGGSVHPDPGAALIGIIVEAVVLELTV